MTTRRQTESAVNAALAELLQGMLPGCEVRGGRTPAAAGRPEGHPDVLITAAGRSPVVIAAGYGPDADPVADAGGWLGVGVAGEPRPVAAAVALRCRESIRKAGSLFFAWRDARLSYCILYESGARFPESGWLKGDIADLADLIAQAYAPQRAVDAAAALERGVDRVANVLDEMAAEWPGIGPDIAGLLGMSDVPQTRRLVGAVIADALIFQERLAGISDAVPPVDLVCGRYIRNPEQETLAAWGEILRVNYWDIFAIGRDILNRIPTAYTNRILRHLAFTIGEVNSAGGSCGHHLTGRIFRRLIAGRRRLATFYTLPPAASLLAGLAVSKMAGIDWGDSEAIGRLRIGDFACGAGALLSAAYEQIAARHAGAGGAPEELHPALMQEVLYGCDVMPMAVHIAGLTLAGRAPAVGFGNARLYTLAYGRQEDGNVRIGALDLLQSAAAMTRFNAGASAQRAGGAGAETAAPAIVDIPDAGFDLVIMNPPFAGNAKRRDADGNVRNAAFAAFGAEIGDQDDMAARLTELARDSCYLGQYGLSSAFAAIADRKVRPGGVIALLLPLNALNGASWAKFRRLIAGRYTDIAIVSIAANSVDLSFSSDTGTAECMVIARRLVAGEEPTERAQFISLRRRPRNFAEAREIVNVVLGRAEVRNLEDGPLGGMPIYLGDALGGEILNAPLVDHENSWRMGRLADAGLAQVMHSLAGGRLRLPDTAAAYDIPMTGLSEVGQLGVHDSYLTMASFGGPFVKEPPAPAANYPSLYSHSAGRETRLICEPDSQLRVRPGMESRALELWATAGRAHLNRDFALSSQALAVAFTERKSIGGRAWPNISFPDERFDYAFTIWGNSTLGLLCCWWHSIRQPASLAGMTRRVIPTLPTLDLRALTDGQLATAQAIFDEFRDQELQLAYLADADANRALLDRRVLCDLLGFDDGAYQGVRRLAARWCAEPSVSGGKKRPAWARFAT